MIPQPPAIPIGPVTVHDVTVPELIGRIRDALTAERQLRVFYVNAHTIRTAGRRPGFANALAEADIRFCDGYGVKLAARLLGYRLRQRMTPPDWIGELATGVASSGGRFFLLGDERDVVDAAGRAMADDLGAQVVGQHHGFFPEEGPENDAVVRTINDSGATILLVGMGTPRQESWILRNAQRLRPRALLAVGALFQWLSGTERRTRVYRWLARHGLEWAARLARHPVLYFDRYIIGLPYVALLVGRERLRNRVRRGA